MFQLASEVETVHMCAIELTGHREEVCSLQPIGRSGTDGSSTACPVYLPDAVYINKTLIARACVVHD